MKVIGEVVHTIRKRSLNLPSVSKKVMLLKDGTMRNIQLELLEDVEGPETENRYVKVVVTPEYCNEGEILSGLVFYKDKDGCERTITDATPWRKNITSWFIRKEKCMTLRRIRVYIAILSDRVFYARREAEMQMQRNSDSALSNNFTALRKSGLMADMTIVCDGVRFSTHKLVLSSRSEVFAAMFSHDDVKESKRSEVVIKDTDKDTMDMFLEFVYGATLPADVSFDCFAELLRLAHMYLVQSLTDICVRKMGEKLGTDNAILGAIFGFLYGEQKLKKDAIKVIAKAETNSMNGYEALQDYPDLVNEINDYRHVNPGKRRTNSQIEAGKRSRN